LLPRCYGGPCRRGPGGDMHQGCLSRSNGDEACICGGHFMHWGYHPVLTEVQKARPRLPPEVTLSGADIASRFPPLIVLVGGPAGWHYPHLGLSPWNTLGMDYVRTSSCLEIVDVCIAPDLFVFSHLVLSWPCLAVWMDQALDPRPPHCFDVPPGAYLSLRRPGERTEPQGLQEEY